MAVLPPGIGVLVEVSRLVAGVGTGGRTTRGAGADGVAGGIAGTGGSVAAGEIGTGAPVGVAVGKGVAAGAATTVKGVDGVTVVAGPGGGPTGTEYLRAAAGEAMIVGVELGGMTMGIATIVGVVVGTKTAGTTPAGTVVSETGIVGAFERALAAEVLIE